MPALFFDGPRNPGFGVQGFGCLGLRAVQGFGFWGLHLGKSHTRRAKGTLRSLGEDFRDMPPFSGTP